MKTRALGLVLAYFGVLVVAVAIGGFDAEPARQVDPAWIFQALIWPILVVVVATGILMVAQRLWALATGRFMAPPAGRAPRRKGLEDGS